MQTDKSHQSEKTDRKGEDKVASCQGVHGHNCMTCITLVNTGWSVSATALITLCLNLLQVPLPNRSE